ncbi:MAG: metal-sensitive transcriptional regulator [Bacteroidetes bacterium]|nr:metal-sensitive transcriptional regulator [Bacteroidota bacterium]MCL5027044.1 metal-sensitive transcriptional regulator [Chloroflexota bacterium]
MAVNSSVGKEDTVAADLVRRLNRIEGQVRGLVRMVEKGSTCEEVLTQIIAARTALDRVAVQLVSSHVAQCVDSLSPEEAAARIGRAVELLVRVS